MPHNPEDVQTEALDTLANYDPASFLDVVASTIEHLKYSRIKLGALLYELADKSNPDQAIWIATVSGLLIGLEHHTAVVSQAFLDKIREFSQGGLRVQPAKEETNELPQA